MDILGQSVHRYDPSSATDETIDVGETVGTLALRRSGGLVVALRSSFAALDPSTGELSTLASLRDPHPQARFNDGYCDPAGRFWAGTAVDPRLAGGAGLYRLGRDGDLVQVLGGITESNGIDWSPDARTMYYVDSATCAVDVFDYHVTSGEIANRRHLIEFSAEEGMPDGLIVDADGLLWIGLWGGNAVRRYSADGSLDRSISLPVSQVTKCAFGGPDLEDLYITTATDELSHAERDAQPHAGGLFRCRPGVRGREAARFNDGARP